MLELNHLRKVSFSSKGIEHDQWLCLCYQNPDDGSKINDIDREVQKNAHIKSKGQCKDKCLKKNSYIVLHNNDCKTPYIDIYIDLMSINVNILSVL